MRTLIWFVRTTRPSRFRLIGPSTRFEDLAGAAGSAGSLRGLGGVAGPAPATAAGIRTFLRVTRLVLPFLRIVPLSVPTATSLPLRVAKRSIVYVPLKPFVPVTLTVFVSGVSAGSCAAEAVPAAPSDTAQTIRAASAAVRIRFMGTSRWGQGRLTSG